MRTTKYITTVLISTLAAFCGCSEEITPERVNKSNNIVFRVAADSWMSEAFTKTRSFDVDGIPVGLSYPEGGEPIMLEAMTGMPVQTEKTLGSKKSGTRGTAKTGFDGSDKFSISGYVSGKDYGTGYTYFTDKTASKTSDGNWTLDESRFWPTKDNVIQFFAWYPTTLQYHNDSKAFATYEVPDAAADQTDLLYARTGMLNVLGDNGLADLQFHHMLTAIVIRGGDGFNMEVKKITFKNIQYKGTFNIDTESWTLENDSKNFEVDIAGHRWLCESEGSYDGRWQKKEGGIWVDDSNDSPILNDVDASGNELTLFMMPQQMGTDAAGNKKQMVITLDENGTEKELTLDLPTTQPWQVGKCVNYTLLPSGISRISLKLGDAIRDGKLLYRSIFQTVVISSWRYVNKTDGSVVKERSPFRFIRLGGISSEDNLDSFGNPLTNFNKISGFYRFDYGNGLNNANDTTAARAEGPLGWQTWGDVVDNDAYKAIYTTQKFSQIYQTSTADESKYSTLYPFGYVMRILGSRLEASSYIDIAERMNKELRKEANKKTDFDLSDGGSKSANCYIIEGGGTYRFKAVKGPSDQEVTGDRVEIKQDSAFIASASYSNGYINFGTIDYKKMKQGNAILTLMNGDTPVWSWHIWSTNRNEWFPSKADQSWNGREFFPIVLGTIFGGKNPKYYEGGTEFEKIESGTDTYQLRTGPSFLNRYNISKDDYNAKWNAAFCDDNGVLLRDYNNNIIKATTSLDNNGFVLKYGYGDPSIIDNLTYSVASYRWGQPVPYSVQCNKLETYRFLFNLPDVNTTPADDSWVLTDQGKKSIYDPTPYGYRMPTKNDFGILSWSNSSSASVNYTTTANRGASVSYDLKAEFLNQFGGSLSLWSSIDSWWFWHWAADPGTANVSGQQSGSIMNFNSDGNYWGDQRWDVDNWRKCMCMVRPVKM